MIQLTGEELSKLTGKTIDELKILLLNESEEPNDKAGETLIELTIDKFKKIEKTRSEQQYNRGIKEKAKAIEKALKPIFEKYDITAEQTEQGILELSEQLKQAKPGKPGGTIDNPDELEKSELFQQRLNEKVQALNDKYSELEKQYNDYQANVKHKQVENAVRSKAIEYLEKKNAVFGEDKSKRVDFFFKALGFDAFDVNENGEINLIDKDGNPLRDNLSNPVTFEKYIGENWLFGYSDAKPGSGGNPPKPKGGEDVGGSLVIKTPEQYNQALKGAKTLQEKAEIQQAYAKTLAEKEAVN